MEDQFRFVALLIRDTSSHLLEYVQYQMSNQRYQNALQRVV